MKAESAIHEVANAYGVLDDTLKIWMKRLPEDFNMWEVYRVIGDAKHAAASDENAGTRSAQGGSSATLGKWEARYGSAGLQEAGSQYRLREQFKNRPR